MQTQLQYAQQGLKFTVPPQSLTCATTRLPYLTTHSPIEVDSLILTHRTQKRTNTRIQTHVDTHALDLELYAPQNYSTYAV